MSGAFSHPTQGKGPQGAGEEMETQAVKPLAWV